ncbi:MAG: hypothetical protein GXO56_08395 [Chloroflexi bacterium]|nr:hypothetical protein [Chloroflexota bacterium]
MSVSPRALTWRDLPLLNRYREQARCLDSRRAAIGGAGFLSAGLLAMLSPATGVAAVRATAEDGLPLVAIAERNPQDDLAVLLYMAPADALTPQTTLTPLIESLASHPALRGAHALWAEAPQQAPWLPAMRTAGFRVLARQRLWRLTSPAHAQASGRWVWPSPQQRWEADRLYADLTPPLVRHLLPSPAAFPTAVVYVAEGQVRGVARWAAGPHGVWAAPVLHPDVENPPAVLAALAAFLQRRGKPLFLAIRDNQMWLESALTALQAQASEPYVFLARWMAQPVTAVQPAAAPAVADAPQPTLFARIETL